MATDPMVNMRLLLRRYAARQAARPSAKAVDIVAGKSVNGETRWLFCVTCQSVTQYPSDVLGKELNVDCVHCGSIITTAPARCTNLLPWKSFNYR